MNLAGTVVAIHLAPTHAAPPHAVTSAVALPGRGLEGDRQFDDPDACDITLIEAEAFDNLKQDHGFEISPAQSRRQVLVRGVKLAHLIGQRFEIGEIECRGIEHCEPCNHLSKMVGTQKVLKGLLHTGLRADITRGGTIRVGDTVRIHDGS